MRNKFSELIKNGVASFTYTPIAKEMPECDPVCRMYNNIYSIPSDTHMSCLDDGTRVITGHMINTPGWEKFCCSYIWGAVDFRASGAWSVAQFLYNRNLKGEKSTLNGDVVYKITPVEPGEQIAMPLPYCPNSYATCESNIPRQIITLTTTGNKMHLLECFNNQSSLNGVAEKMNQSSWVKGDNWVVFENKIVGLVGDEVCIINTNKN